MYATLTKHYTFFFYMIRAPPSSPLFPYTTLFRSDLAHDLGQGRARDDAVLHDVVGRDAAHGGEGGLATSPDRGDRKSTRLNSSHRCISYAVFCLKKKNRDKYKNLL